MINDRAFRQRIKNSLIITSISLGVVLALVLLYGFFDTIPQRLEKEIKLGHYYKFNTKDLPTLDRQVASIQKAQDRIKAEELAENESVVAEKPRRTGNFKEPRIAILLTNLGLNQNSTELALSLPEEISLGFLPYVTNLKHLWHKAHELKHEIFVYLPFETQKYPSESPGHMPILLGATDAENIKRLNALLNPFKGFVGVYGSYKEVFTSDQAKSNPIFEELKKRNLKLFMGRINEMKSGSYDDTEMITADVILDKEPNIVSIKQNLDKLIEIAETKKRAVAYAEGYPVTIYTLKAWLPILQKRGIKLVPVSHIMDEEIGDHDGL